MPSRLIRLLAIAVALCLSTTIANAAEIRVVPLDPIDQKTLIREPPRIAILEGTIQPGDFEKVRSFILKGPGADVIRLASPGGDLAEAMRIGEFIRALKLTTWVPWKIAKATGNSDSMVASWAASWGVKDFRANFKCTGACFFVFVAGIYRHGLPPVGLGFGRPYSHRSLGDLLRRRPDQTRAAIEDYLRKMDVPQKYGNEMFSLPRDKVRWISRDEFNSDFFGFIPGLRDQARTRCEGRGLGSAEEAELRRLNARSYNEITPAETARRNELVAKVNAESDCEEDFRTELAHRALQEVLHQADPAQRRLQ